jgi:PAS domain S-box-containing protein
MEKRDKSIVQLQHELNALKKQVTRLRKSESEYKKANTKLQEIGEKHRSLVEKACDGIAIIQDMVIAYVNPHLAGMMGYSTKYLKNKPFIDFIHPDELPEVVDRHKRRLAGEEVPSIYESAIKAKDGQKVLVEFNVSHNLYQGKPTTFVFVRDITERKKEENIQASVYMISEAAYLAENLHEFYQSIHKIIAELMPAKDNFYIALFDESTNMLNFPYFVDEEEENPGPQKLGKGLTEYVLRTGRSLLASPKVFNDLAKKGEVISIGPPSIDWLGVPLKIGGKTIGVLTVQSYTKGVRYTEEEKNVLTFIAEQVAMAIERKQATQALESSREQYQNLVEKAGIAILIDDKGGNFQYVNERYAKLFGYTEEEMRKKSIQDVVFSEDLDMVMRYHKNRVQGKKAPSRYEFRGIKKDGSLIYLEINAMARKKGKKIIGTRCYLWDISARKKAEKALSLSEEKYKTIAENIEVGIYRTTSGADGRFIEANPAIVRMFGYKDKEEFLGVDVTKLYHSPKGRESFQKKMLREGFVKNEEVLLKKKDGTPFLGSVCAVTVKDEKGKIRYFDGIVEDITDRKEAEETLKSSLLEKEVLLREIHHRVKNNLQVISSLLNLQSRHVEDEPALDMFQESRNRVRSMALVHEKLYRSEDLAKVDFCEYIRSLGRHLLISYGVNSTAIDLDVSVEDVFLDINTSIPCGLIINELISNSIKHGFTDRKNGKICVALRPEKNSKYKLVVSDDGVGLPKGLDVTQTESLGLQLVTMLVEQLQGTLHVDNSEGTSFEIVFEKLDYRARH